jgi:hypothetical protein
LLATLVYDQVTAVGNALGIYGKHIDAVCGCFDEACCLSFWCGPCMLTRVHREVLIDIEKENNVKNHKAKEYKYNFGKFEVVNSMFDGVKIR